MDKEISPDTMKRFLGDYIYTLGMVQSINMNESLYVLAPEIVNNLDRFMKSGEIRNKIRKSLNYDISDGHLANLWEGKFEEEKISERVNSALTLYNKI